MAHITRFPPSAGLINGELICHRLDRRRWAVASYYWRASSLAAEHDVFAHGNH